MKSWTPTRIVALLLLLCVAMLAACAPQTAVETNPQEGAPAAGAGETTAPEGTTGEAAEEAATPEGTTEEVAEEAATPEGTTETAAGETADLPDFELAVASGADPVDLDPRKTWVGPGYSINAHMFEALVFRRQNGDAMELFPLLAESWEVVDDVTWEFKIREGVKFHNGADLDAEAVAFTLTSIMDEEFATPLKTWTNDIESVEVVDSHTVRITTLYPTRGLLNSLAQVPIVEPGAVEEMGAEFTLRPVGTGPYQLVSYTPNSTVVVERFADYWGEPAQASRITFRIMPENATRLAALEAGEVQVAENLPPDKLQSIEATPGLQVASSPTLRVDKLILNFNNEWVQNKEFRQALSMAIDRESIVQNILAGTTIPANSVSPPGTIGYDESLPVYPYDLEEAQRLLEESGYDGSPIKVGGPIGRYSMDKQVSEAIAGMFSRLGINVDFEALAWSEFIAKANEGYYDVYFIGITDFTLNPTSHWRSTYHSEMARGWYSNERIDEIIDQSAAELDDEAVIELYREGQRLLYEEMATIPLYYEPQLIGVSERVEGFETRLDEYVIVRDVTLNQ
jgi:peptide/nickel transport system substrate-binding protein